MNAAVVLVWIACGAIGYVVGKGKGRATLGLVLGLLLGLIGLIIIALLKPKSPATVYPYQESSGFGTPYPNAGPSPQPQEQPAAQWAPDPSGRHEQRWWSGIGWTDDVTDAGVRSTDAL